MKVKKIVSLILAAVVAISMFGFPVLADSSSTVVININSMSDWNSFIKGGREVSCTANTKEIDVRICADLDFTGQGINVLAENNGPYAGGTYPYFKIDSTSATNPVTTVLTGWDASTNKPTMRTLKNMNISSDAKIYSGGNTSVAMDAVGEIFEAASINDLAFNNINLGLTGYSEDNCKSSQYNFLTANEVSNVSINNFTVSSSNGEKISYFNLLNGLSETDNATCNSIDNVHASNIIINVANGTNYEGIQGLADSANAISNSSVSNYAINGDVTNFSGLFNSIGAGTVSNSYVSGIKINGTASYVSGFGFTQGTIQNSFVRDMTVSKLADGGYFGGICDGEVFSDNTAGGTATVDSNNFYNVYVDITDSQLTSPFFGCEVDNLTKTDNAIQAKFTSKNVFYTDANNKFDSSTLFSGATNLVDRSQFNPQEVTSNQLKSVDILNKLNQEIGNNTSTANNWSLSGSVNDGYPTPLELAEIGVTYRTHVQNIGWQPYMSNGAEAGTEGKSLRVEAMNISLTGAPAGASITYQAHVQNIGWQKAVTNGAEAGTDGKGLRVEAFRITLNGLSGYQVRYRAYVQGIGWQSWQVTKDGTDISKAAVAGTSGQSKRVEAVEIVVEKQ
jgi:hypothetical protein